MFNREEKTPAAAVPARRPEQLKDRPSVAPLVDIFENDQEVLLQADLPGVDSDGLHLSFDGGQLTLEAHRLPEAANQLLAAEYRPFDYRRTFLIPDGIDPTKIAAELKNGILLVHLPKTEPIKPRRIPIKA